MTGQALPPSSLPTTEWPNISLITEVQKGRIETHSQRFKLAASVVPGNNPGVPQLTGLLVARGRPQT